MLSTDSSPLHRLDSSKDINSTIKSIKELDGKRENPFTPDHSKRTSHRGAANKKIREKINSPIVNINATTVASLTPIKGSRSSLTIEARKKSEEEEKRLLLSPASKNRPKAMTLSAGSIDSLGGLRASGSSRLSMSTTSSFASSTSSLQMPQLTMEQRNKKFEEWIKIATDNKITSKNSWNVSLIDYFSELTFLRHDSQKSINFQKASCTLDGCVKIYSTRVDSVADETGKLLNGLSNVGSGNNFKFSNDGDDDGKDGDSDSDGISSISISNSKLKSSKRTKRKPSSTIEQKPENLLMKIPETLIPQNDPLFRKSCVMFDTTASQGEESICSRLPIDSQGLLQFEGSIGEVEDVIRLGKSSPLRESSFIGGDGFIDFSDIISLSKRSNRTTFLPTLKSHCLPGKSSNLDIEILLEPTFGDVDFDNNGNGANNGNNDDDVDFGNDFDDGNTLYNDEHRENLSQAAAAMMMFGTNDLSGTEKGDFSLGEDFDYTNEYSDVMKSSNWAGVQHWKIQRPYLMAAAANTSSTSSSSSSNDNVTSKKKDMTVLIDFERPSSFSHLEKSNTLLSKGQLDERTRGIKGVINKNLLPYDYQFDVESLFKLFTIKECRIPTQGLRVLGKSITENSISKRDDFVENNDDYGEIINDFDDTVNDNNNNNDNNFKIMNVMNDMVAVIPQGYSTLDNYNSWDQTNKRLKAKNVDIQLLKNELWEVMKNSNSSDKVCFKSLMRKYPIGEDITSSYVFICLLHLSNENNLHLENIDGDIRDIQIGGFK